MFPRDILFFGDSLTWGMAHRYTGRYETTWPRIIEPEINKRGFCVVESALCSRTTSLDDASANEWLIGGEGHYFNGLAHFVPEFLSRSPRALVILLGTNDLKVHVRSTVRTRGRMDASAIAMSCAKIGLLAKQIHASTARLKKYPFTVILVSPPPVKLNSHSRDLGYDDTSVKMSMEFPAAYKKVCAEHGFEFVHVRNIDMEESVDGVHITEKANAQIAKKVWEKLDKILEKKTPILSVAISSGPVSRKRQVDDANGNHGEDDDGDDGDDDDESGFKTLSKRSPDSSRRTSARRQRRRHHQEKEQERDSESPQTVVAGHSDENEEADDDKEMVNNKVLRWATCYKCEKQRLTRTWDGQSRKWCCQNEFWSKRLTEWKIGCGWSQDEKEDHDKAFKVASTPSLVTLAAIAEKSRPPIFQPIITNNAKANVVYEAIADDSSTNVSLIMASASEEFPDAGEVIPVPATRGHNNSSSSSIDSRIVRRIKEKPTSLENKPHIVKIKKPSAAAPAAPPPNPGYPQQIYLLNKPNSVMIQPHMHSHVSPMMHGIGSMPPQQTSLPTTYDMLGKRIQPFIEKIQSQLSSDYNGAIVKLMDILLDEVSSSESQYGAFMELRRLFTNYPDIVYQIDTLAFTHPIVRSYYQQYSQPPPRVQQPMQHPGQYMYYPQYYPSGPQRMQ